MCWMDIRRGRDALRDGVDSVREHEDANGHSWGWAYVDDDGISIRRGTGRIPTYVEPPVAEAALVHTRFATVGDITVENAHPFAVERGGSVVAALAHNGTWYEAPDIEGWSDSRAMAAMLGEWLTEQPDLAFEDAFARLGRMTGETVVALHEDGTCYVHSGRFDITRDGGAVSSSGHEEELDEGVHVLEPGVEAA